MALGDLLRGERAVLAEPVGDPLAHDEDRTHRVGREQGGEHALRPARLDRVQQHVLQVVAQGHVACPVLRLQAAYLGVQEGQPLAVGHVEHDRLHHAADARQWIVPGLPGGGPAAVQDVPDGRLEERGQQGLLVRVVVVERGHGDADPAGDVPDRSPVVSVLVEGFHGVSQDRGQFERPVGAPVLHRWRGVLARLGVQRLSSRRVAIGDIVGPWRRNGSSPVLSGRSGKPGDRCPACSHFPGRDRQKLVPREELTDRRHPSTF